VHFQAGGGGKTAQRIPVPSWPLNVRPDCGRLQATVRNHTRQSVSSSHDKELMAASSRATLMAELNQGSVSHAYWISKACEMRTLQNLRQHAAQQPKTTAVAAADANPTSPEGEPEQEANGNNRSQTRQSCRLKESEKAAKTAAAKPTAAAAANTTPLDPPSMTAWTGRW